MFFLPGRSGFSPGPTGPGRFLISIPEHAGHPEDLLLLEQNPIKQSSLALEVSICLTLILSSRALVLLDHFLLLI